MIEGTEGYWRVREGAGGYGKEGEGTGDQGKPQDDTGGYERVRRVQESTEGYQRGSYCRRP